MALLIFFWFWFVGVCISVQPADGYIISLSVVFLTWVDRVFCVCRASEAFWGLRLRTSFCLSTSAPGGGGGEQGLRASGGVKSRLPTWLLAARRAALAWQAPTPPCNVCHSEAFSSCQLPLSWLRRTDFGWGTLCQCPWALPAAAPEPSVWDWRPRETPSVCSDTNPDSACWAREEGACALGL